MLRLKPFLCATLFLIILIAGISSASSPLPREADRPQLSGHAADIYRKAQKGHFYKEAQKLSPEIRPTSDGQSFVAIWRPKTEPVKWIVSLHGTEGFATDVMALWQPSAKPYNIGIISLQWWMGDGPNSYYTPAQSYREIESVLKSLRVQPGTVMFHGFSRGSANSYAVAALDSGRGRYFTLNIADSGSPQLDFPATRSIIDGTFGQRPLAGTRWITSAGARDPHPDRDGIQGMRQAAKWLKEQGATVLLSIEDSKEGHGALQHSPANMKKALELFAGK